MEKICSGEVIRLVSEELKELKAQRVRILLTNIAYFTALLIVSLFMLFKNAGQWIYLPVAALVVFYIFIDRPMLKGFEQSLRAAILKYGVFNNLDEWSYEPKKGLSPDIIKDAGFINVIKSSSFLSRELIRGNKGKIQVEIADVTFPIYEGGFNKMFSGCLMHITVPGAKMEEMDVRAGDVSQLKPGREKKLAAKLGEFIPGSLYLHRKGENLDVLLRGRFVGFQVNPLSEVRESTLGSDPLPELKTVLMLADDNIG